MEHPNFIPLNVCWESVCEVDNFSFASDFPFFIELYLKHFSIICFVMDIIKLFTSHIFGVNNNTITAIGGGVVEIG